MSRLIFGAKLLASMALLWFVFRKVDLSVIASQLFTARPLFLAVSLLLFLLTPVLAACRWHIVLSSLGQRIGFPRLLRYVWISTFFGQILPASVGPDAVRVWLAWRDGLPTRATVHSVALERVAMMISLLILVLALQPFSFDFFDSLKLTYAPPLIALVASVGLIVLLMADRLTRWLPQWRIVRAAANLSADSRLLLLRSRSVSRLFIVSFLSHLNFAFCAWWIGLALSLNLSLFNFVVLIPLVTLVTLIPISIAGWGVREGTLVFLLSGLGAPTSAALALSVLFGLAAALASVPGSIMWWRGGHHIVAVDGLKTGVPTTGTS